MTKTVILALMLSFECFAQGLNSFVEKSIEFADLQMKNTLTEINNTTTKHPKVTDNINGNWITTDHGGWTSGFFSGCAWYLAELYDSTYWTGIAKSWTVDLESQKHNTGDHDIGFRIMSSFGNGYRLKNIDSYKDIILTAANTLATRYDSTIGCIRSWDFGSWNYPVIIDNMMNLELLFWAAENGGGDHLREIAINHAYKTIEHHVRTDGSTYHLVDFNDDGTLIGKQTFQGYNNESTWSRGQAWGIYGFTVAYRYSGDVRFLNTAARLAEYFIANLPDDYVPYYDFEDPNIPDVPRDASAAAICSAALFELDEYAPEGEFKQAAKNILNSLMTFYLAEGTVHNSILQKGCERKDGPERGLIYGDYYFLESIFRYLQLEEASQPEMASSITQFGITWHFDKEYEVGQFVNGDYWVVGPVIIESVTPNPGPPQVDETVRYNYISNFINQFGDTELQNNETMRNGSMVNPTWGANQGYDSGSKSYNASLSIGFPYSMNTNESMISTVSNTELPNTPLLPFYSEKSRSVLKTAAILTCLAEAPPEDAFRPPYASTWKPIYRASNLKRELLPKLKAVPNTPTIQAMERLVERPWLDHINNWMLGGTAPTENHASYGREYARTVSLVGLRLMVEGTQEEKEKLLIRFVQLGIDLHGLRKAGAKWHMGGGITSGRKWPVVFASIFLDDADMQTFPGASEFHEDQETYYGVSWTGETALWQMIKHHGTAPMYEHKHPDDWTDKDHRSHGYRVCCNGLAWIGEALGALLISGKQIWNHDAFFDYCDRFINEPTQQYRDAGLTSNLSLLGKAFDPFVQNMYTTYRDSVPEQPGATNNMKWVTYQYVPDENAPTSVTESNDLDYDFRLYQNYPNPFNPSTTISYQIPQREFVSISIFNVLGEKIKILYSGEKSTGKHQITWDASNQSSGIFFYTIKTKSGFTQTKKLILLK